MPTDPWELIKLIWPLIVLQLAAELYALADLIRRQKTRTLNFPIWLVIIIFGQLLGSIAYLLWGRAEG